MHAPPRAPAAEDASEDTKLARPARVSVRGSGRPEQLRLPCRRLDNQVGGAERHLIRVRLRLRLRVSTSR